MIGEGKALIDGLNGGDLQIRRDQEAVDHVILRVFGIRRVVGLVQQAAGRNGSVEGKAPIADVRRVQNAGDPGFHVDRIGVQRAGEGLIPVAARDNVVALGVFLVQQAKKLLGLSLLPLAVVIGLQMEVDQNELPFAALDGDGRSPPKGYRRRSKVPSEWTETIRRV